MDRKEEVLSNQQIPSRFYPCKSGLKWGAGMELKQVKRVILPVTKSGTKLVRDSAEDFAWEYVYVVFCALCGEEKTITAVKVRELRKVVCGCEKESVYVGIPNIVPAVPTQARSITIYISQGALDGLDRMATRLGCGRGRAIEALLDE